MAGALSSDQMSAMMGTGNNTQPQTPAQPTGQRAQPEWLTAMMNSSLQPSQSAAVLGHSTGIMGNLIKGAGTAASAMLPSPQNTTDQGIGGIKQIGGDILSAGAQNAGPVGADMMAHAPAFAQDVAGNTQGLKPSNPAQQTGATMASIGEAAIPIAGDASIAKAAGDTSLLSKATGAVSNVASKIGDMTGLTDWLAKRATQKATNAVASTAETMTLNEQKTATLEGRLKTGIKGGFSPSQTENRAGEILSGQIGSNSAKNVPIIQDAIASRGKEAEQFLGMNGKPISNEEDYTMFDNMKKAAVKYMTPEQMTNYDHTINQFQGELRGMGSMNTGTYYKALKEFEQNVTSRLRQGNEALLTDSGSAQLQAAKDVRTAVRDMIGQKNPEFKGKMFDIASLYDALDNTVTKAVKTDTFSKKYPLTSKALKYGAEAVGAGAIYKGAKESGAPLP